jgi:hypothetical protein
MTREQDAAVRSQHKDVLSANDTVRKEQSVFFGDFL